MTVTKVVVKQPVCFNKTKTRLQVIQVRIIQMNGTQKENQNIKKVTHKSEMSLYACTYETKKSLYQIMQK